MQTNQICNKPSVDNSPVPPPLAWIGLDWGDQSHAFVLEEPSGLRISETITHSAENLHQWLKQQEQKYGGRPVSLAIEASRGPVIQVLLQYPWLTIYPINPFTSARYRTAFTPSGAKDDLPDAQVLVDLVRRHADKLRPLHQQDPLTIQLGGLVEARRRIVDQRTSALNQLTSLLKNYFPQALDLVGKLETELAGAFLRKWSDLISLKAARVSTIKKFYYQHQVRSQALVDQRLELITQAVALTTSHAHVSVSVLQLKQLLDQVEVLQKHIKIFDQEIKRVFAEHPNAPLCRELPGAGAQMAPRLCVALGTLRWLYRDPASLQKYAGLAPVREKSGGQLWTHWRWAAPKFLRQTFVEWAGLTVQYCPWAKVYYDRMIKKGKKHAVILRALAFKWVRILWKCWQDGTAYDEKRYLEQLVRRKSPNAVVTQI